MVIAWLKKKKRRTLNVFESNNFHICRSKTSEECVCVLSAPSCNPNAGEYVALSILLYVNRRWWLSFQVVHIVIERWWEQRLNYNLSSLDFRSFGSNFMNRKLKRKWNKTNRKETRKKITHFCFRFWFKRHWTIDVNKRCRKKWSFQNP